ncbi:MAG: regulatory protein RecX [Candidatus Eisenbacteria sp.]|nr:regulatory protein RecX [Candidatus Eisenbacteria bacterium]
MDRTTLQRAKDLAAKHLGRRMRSEREIEMYLGGKGFDTDTITQVVCDFRRVGLLDDRALIRNWADRRLALRPSGRLALERKLAARGIDEEVLAQELDDIYATVSEDDLCEKAAAGCLRRIGNLPAAKRRGKLYRFLLQRGFSRSVITEFLEEMDV